MLYQQPIWECEVTGREHLTYEQALESEGRDEANRAEFKFCETLRRRILQRVQFQTLRLDPLVDDVYEHLRYNFAVGEIVHCTLGDYVYLAKILDVLPGVDGERHHYNHEKKNDPASVGSTAHSPSSEATESDEDDIPRQPNGRLRFPDAFLLPTESSAMNGHSNNDVSVSSSSANSNTTVDNKNGTDSTGDPPLRFRVQLIDEYEMPLENCARIVESSEIKRDKNVFCRHMIQRLIRECATKDSYVGAPWLIKRNVARQYGIDTTLPPHLQEAQDLAYAKQARKRKAPVKTPDEKEAEKRARKEESILQKAKLKEEKERQREERRKQAAVKYPLEDLDLPIYRKDPNMNWLLIDMTPGRYTGAEIIPYPSGGRSERPIPHKCTAIPAELFDSFISTWSFLTVFSEPLELTPFSIDDFERALCQSPSQPKSPFIIESNVCLLNAIIQERNQNTASETANGVAVDDYLDALEEEKGSDGKRLERRPPKDAENDTLFSLRRQSIERGWRDKEQLRICKGWDDKMIKGGHDRKGWETALIGCLNDVATPDLVPDLDRILRHLVPRHNSTAAERERQYASLTMKQKVTLFEFLVSVVNETMLIKDYMEQCQEQLTEFRRQKMELNKESKQIAARRAELDRRDRAEKEEEKDSTEMEESESEYENEHEEEPDAQDEQSNSDEDLQDNTDSDSSEGSERISRSRQKRGRPRRGRIHQSRQEKLKQKQKERMEKEATRQKLYAKQREAAKARNQELRQKAEERRKLDEEEKALRKKEEQIEKDMRKYMTLRMRPLGRDRFYNRYIYLDNIGTSDTYGTGRLYVQSPSHVDIQMMLERDRCPEDQPEQPWGRGGGRWFILQLMQAHGFHEESEWLDKQMDSLLNKDSSKKDSGPQAWWRYYSEPEEVRQLLSWLNPKGTREYKLKNEISKRQNYIIESMQKRVQILSKQESQSSKRSAKTRASTQNNA